MHRFALLLCFAASLWAHGDLHDRIEALTRQIARAPHDLNLLEERARLSQQHGDWISADRDLATLAQLQPERPGLAQLRGEGAFAQGRWSEAVAFFEAELNRQPDSPGLQLRLARAMAANAQPERALQAFDRGLSTVSDPRPDDFLARSRVQESLGDLSAAAAGLEAGCSRIGNTPSLLLPLIELERKLGRFDRAQHWVDLLVALSQRPERYLLLRAQIHLQAGQREGAQHAALEARAALAQLSPAQQARPDTQALAASLQTFLQTLSQP